MELTPDEMDELSISLLREWWIISTQALVSAIGSTEALRSQRPYFINSGRAAAFEIKNLIGPPGNDAGSILALWFGVAHHQGSDAKVVIKASSKDHAIAEMTDCALKGYCSEICYCWCIYASYGGNDLDHDYEIELIKCLPWGDNDCGFQMLRKGTTPVTNRSIEVPIPKISAEMENFLRHAYLGEMWVNVTRAFLDTTEKQRASKILCDGMRKSGIALGTHLVSKSFSKDIYPGDLIHWLNALHRKSDSCSFGERCSEGEITECPFSAAPIEICHQYESFYNGVLEIVFPDYEFVYDRMLTKGDRSCHWTIRKKCLDLGNNVLKGSDEEEMLKKLKWRLTNGEITLEEYRQLKNEILDM